MAARPAPIVERETKNMCRRVACSECNKATFAGCGMHVEQVLGGVPAEQRCSCNQQSSLPPREAAEKRKGWPFG
jgi:hypothetical protein